MSIELWNLGWQIVLVIFISLIAISIIGDVVTILKERKMVRKSKEVLDQYPSQVDDPEGLLDAGNINLKTDSMRRTLKELVKRQDKKNEFRYEKED